MAPSLSRCDACFAKPRTPCKRKGDEICPRSVPRLPTLDGYFENAEALARVVRKALDYKGAVTRGEVRRALTKFERVRDASKVKER